MATQPTDALLTPAEVAALFRVNPKTVTRWARAGKISAIRTLGGGEEGVGGLGGHGWLLGGWNGALGPLSLLYGRKRPVHHHPNGSFLADRVTSHPRVGGPGTDL